MRTRIRVLTLNDGSVWYRPQHRSWLRWWDIIQIDTDDLEDAKKEVDRHIRKQERNNRQKVKKTQYMRYPWYPNGYN